MIRALAEKNFSELDKLSKMADRSVKMLSLDHRKRDVNPGFDSENVPLLVSLNKLEQPFHSVPKLNIPNVSKIISLKSYQEPSIENTCQATSMDEPQNCAGGAKDETDCDVTDVEKSEVEWCIQEEKGPPWPGIEAVIKSYKNFEAARCHELSELSRRNAELRAAAAGWSQDAARRGDVARALLAERAALAAEEAAVRASLQRLLEAVHALTQ
ncbi:hypothetical protein EVAR_42699_1 [Eumeta japonica]|uniref:Uncharacterized protein n=1 Tax=Eumeta variegata TaxID=151549 RepID=A0A4C1WY74_EUMVA|nr:hypothetical protein EVAR_42699_1 [Eumeta japonica]